MTQPREILIDTTELEPPLPLAKLQEAILQMQEGSYIVMLHRFVPCVINDLLAAKGLKSMSKKLSDESFRIVFWLQDDQQTADFLAQSEL